MTDLNLAYMNEGFDNNNNNNDDYQSLISQYQSQQALPQQNKKQMQPQMQPQIQSQMQQQMQQEQQLPMTPQLPPMQIQMQQPQAKIEGFFNYGGGSSSNDNRRHPEYSFWDRMVMSKREVLKLFILSIVIILGISLEKIGYHYISNYINANDLSNLQEFLLRLSFPVVVFLLLWIIKSL